MIRQTLQWNAKDAKCGCWSPCDRRGRPSHQLRDWWSPEYSSNPHPDCRLHHLQVSHVAEELFNLINQTHKEMERGHCVCMYLFAHNLDTIWSPTFTTRPLGAEKKYVFLVFRMFNMI